MAIIEDEFLELTTDLDLASFWDENDRCSMHTTAKPRCSMSFSPDDHWLFEFTNIPSTLRYYRDKPYRDNLHREVNAVLKQYVGRAYFDEDSWIYQPQRIEFLFGCRFAYAETSTPWLTHATDNPTDFAKMLDKVEQTDLRTWAFPDEYLQEREQRKAEGKPMPLLGGGSRGPATIMTSVLSPETVFYWIEDHPALMRRFRDLLAQKIVELNTFFREFSGNPHKGWWITDDNCALFSPKLYKQYCYPVLETVFEALAPDIKTRYQHSDSAMAHLLGLQYDLGIRRVNYGPEVPVALIREKMPDAWIDGHMPPFLLRNGNPEQIRQRIRDDFAAAGASGGLNITTAGSLAAGTGVGRMRYMMKVVQEETRY